MINKYMKNNKESKLIKTTAGVALASKAVLGAGVATTNVDQAPADKLADEQKAAQEAADKANGTKNNAQEAADKADSAKKDADSNFNAAKSN